MLGFNKRNAPESMTESSEATFMQDVIETSREIPVVAYFSAAWCGPCKTFGPELSKAVGAANGAVKLVKIDVDANQRLATQMGVKSIPAVFAFVDGRPIDGFLGAKTASELAAFVDKLSLQNGAENVAEAIEQAEEFLEQGAAVNAAQAFAAILGKVPDSAGAYRGLVRAHLALGETARAKAILDSIPEEIASAAEIETARAAVDLALQAEKAGPVSDLKRRVGENPDDHQARLDLAVALHAEGNVAEAVDELLELFRRDREWNEQAARTQLLKIFDSLKPNDPVALRGRRRLSSMIFS